MNEKNRDIRSWIQHGFHLTRPALENYTEFIAMIQELYTERPQRYQEILDLMQRDFPAYLARLKTDEEGRHLPGGRVPQILFCLADAGGRMLGSVRIRTRLTPELEYEGGHIGYDIRPSERRKGYGALQLRLALEECRRIGLKRVLVTCDDDNAASARVIERNGGVLENIVESLEGDGPVRRYWIAL